MAQVELAVQLRPEIGGRRPRRLRRLGRVPAVLYGGGEEPVVLSLDQTYLEKKIGPLHENQIVSLRIEDNDKAHNSPAIVKDIQVDCMTGAILHIDFQQIALDEKLTATVPIVAVGESIGVSRDGGILEHIIREIEIRCLPADLPEKIEVDVSSLCIGDTIYVEDIPSSRGWEVLTEPKQSIFTVTAPIVEEEVAEEAVEEEAVEGAEAAPAEAEAETTKSPESEAG
ncbi:MAG: 50S ribosomal protein L25 [Candidatus Euphemobacter frigidus]|nr:50S ribosomal protein L25 [Candidatus Euphemobacter frigidus]MDP8275916.1 50S ribosomal protein L25 [Candidatus Euphemobacter frigidus]